MVAYSECSLAKDQPIGKPTRFKFTCHSFFAPAALCTGFLGIRTTDGGCSFQTSIRITNDIDGLFGYNVVLPGPVYTTRAAADPERVKQIVTRDAAHALFVHYVLLISRVRRLYFERVLHLTTYRELCFDRLSAEHKLVAIHMACPAPELDPRVVIVTRSTARPTAGVTDLMVQKVYELARIHAYTASTSVPVTPTAPPPCRQGGHTPRGKKRDREVEIERAPDARDECFLCATSAADVRFPCSRHFACGPCVRKWWKSTATHANDGTITCPFCRGTGEVENLRYRDSGAVYVLPLYRLRNTASVNYDESED
jgi:hypothetical protein